MIITATFPNAYGFPLIQLPRKSEEINPLAIERGWKKFPLIQLPRKSEAANQMPGENAVGMFPLIQLPRKSEENP